MNETLQIDKSWTLFIDRDGVINHEKKLDYILSWDEFKFYDDVPKALEIFARIFGTIVLVTNQRGIGKGLMTEEDLENIHSNMLEKISDANGRIDNIYYCTSLDDNSPNRKPNPGMAHQAKNDFPNIDFAKSIMIGNKLSDMQFGRNAGLYTIYLATTNPEVTMPHPEVDMRFDTLMEVAEHLQKLVTKS